MNDVGIESIWPELPQKARLVKKENKLFFAKLARLDTKKLDVAMHDIHEEVFAKTNCLNCANCCKTVGPLLKPKDIEVLAKDQGINTRAFEEKFLRQDEDGDFVFRTMPCPFLEPDNSCRVYHIRPKACREFPHTNSIRQREILPLTEKNVAICPAVYEITERMKIALKQPEKKGFGGG